MEKKDLFITVSGRSGSGKSRLTYLLKNFLRKNGFDIEYLANTDLPTESKFNRAMGKNFHEAINEIKRTRKITINEMQTNEGIKCKPPKK